MAAAGALIAAATSWPLLLAGRAFAWVARGLRTPARKALLAEAVTPQSYGRAFGFERAMDTLGAVIAPVAALGLLKAGLTHRQVLWLAVAPAVLAAGSILFLVNEAPARSSSQQPFMATVRSLPRGAYVGIEETLEDALAADMLPGGLRGSGSVPWRSSMG